MENDSPSLPVVYKYIQDFQMHDIDFPVGVEENPAVNTHLAEVSQTSPNPAVSNARFNVTLPETTDVSVQHRFSQAQ